MVSRSRKTFAMLFCPDSDASKAAGQLPGEALFQDREVDLREEWHWTSVNHLLRHPTDISSLPAASFTSGYRGRFLPTQESNKENSYE